MAQAERAAERQEAERQEELAWLRSGGARPQTAPTLAAPQEDHYDEADAGLLMGLGGGTRFHRGDPARSNVGSACASRGWPQ